jgi:hypothetical protein
MLHRRVSVPRPSVRMLLVGPVDPPTGLLLSPWQTRFIKKEGCFPHSHRPQHFPPHTTAALAPALCFVCSCSSSTRPPRALLTLLLLLFRVSGIASCYGYGDPMQTAEKAAPGYDACCKCYNSNVSVEPVEVCCKWFIWMLQK